MRRNRLFWIEVHILSYIDWWNAVENCEDVSPTYEKETINLINYQQQKSHKIPLDALDRKRVKTGFEYHEVNNIFNCLDGTGINCHSSRPK